jgi:Tfp pilus assembly protein PilE
LSSYVVAVIGILAAIPIPQFGLYRRRSFDASATADLAAASFNGTSTHHNGTGKATAPQ